jgi:hypothetical protein
MRWRGAKRAGLKEIHVKVITKITPRERFIRQVQENINQNTMSALETAEALAKIRDWLFEDAAKAGVKTFHGGRYAETGAEMIHKLLGIPARTISSYLYVLGVEGELKEALKDPKFNKDKIPAISAVPLKYKKQVERLVVTQKDLGVYTIIQIVRALKRADSYGEEIAIKELLKKNYEDMPPLQVVYYLNKVVPTEEERVKEPADALKFAAEKAIALMELLKSFDDFHRPLVARNLNALGFYLQNYLQGKDMKDLKIEKPKLLN